MMTAMLRITIAGLKILNVFFFFSCLFVIGCRGTRMCHLSDVGEQECAICMEEMSSWFVILYFTCHFNFSPELSFEGTIFVHTNVDLSVKYVYCIRIVKNFTNSEGSHSLNLLNKKPF